jgi:hypothetical protein
MNEIKKRAKKIFFHPWKDKKLKIFIVKVLCHLTFVIIVCAINLTMNKQAHTCYSKTAEEGIGAICQKVHEWCLHHESERKTPLVTKGITPNRLG